MTFLSNRRRLVLTVVPEMGATAPIMSTMNHENLSSALFGKVRRAVLGLFFSRPEDSIYLRQVCRIIGAGQGAVQRELKRLTDAGVLTRVGRGRQMHYQANRNCPVFEELRDLMMKTAGMADVLRKALGSVVDKIDMAFVYGSQANGTVRAMSDIDLLIVGSAEDLALHRAITQAEELLARAINYIVLDPQEFERRRAEEGGFLERVLSREKIFIIGGSEDV